MGELDARIPCTVETRTRLRRLRGDAERYEDVLRRLIQMYEKIDTEKTENTKKMDEIKQNSGEVDSDSEQFDAITTGSDLSDYEI